MREIKFRVWDIVRNKMRGEDDLWLWDIPYNEIFIHTPDQRALNIMQYIGLTDKNGKEIYEGDLLKDKEGFIWTVIALINGTFKISCDDLFAVESADLISKSCEVIGNIYEKPNENMIIKIYANDELKHVGVNKFIATQNYNMYCELFGRDNVKVERFSNESLID